MVETKTPEYWEGLAKKGEIQKDISSQIETLLKKYSEAGPNGIINFETKPFPFLKEFLTNLNEELDEIFSKYQNLQSPRFSPIIRLKSKWTMFHTFFQSSNI